MDHTTGSPPQRGAIPFDQLSLPPFHTFDDRWFLLTAGTLDGGAFNTMTISWGFMGVMWNRPHVITVVRPTRYTYGFMESSPDFTLALFPEDFEPQLLLCGQSSGRDTDKIAETGLTPIPSTLVGSPGFDEAELILECRKAYFQDLDPRNFVDPRIAGDYDNDHHRAWWGEVVAVMGTPAWRR